MNLTQVIRCISLWNPWATFCVSADKTFETRHWPTKYRGLLLIHAAKRPIDHDGKRLLEHIRFNGLLWSGYIIGAVDLVDCWSISSSSLVQSGSLEVCPLPTGNELLFGDYTPGRFAWELKNPRRFANPILFKGRQGFFNVPAKAVAKQLREVAHA